MNLHLKIWNVVRYLLIVAIFALILKKVHLLDVIEQIRRVAWWEVPLIITATLLVTFLHALRFWHLLRAIEPNIKLMDVVNFHLISMYYSILTPTSLGQDIVRGVLLKKISSHKTIWSATWINKVSFLCGWFIFIGGMLLFFAAEKMERLHVYILLGASFLMFAGIFFSFNKTFTRPINRFLQRFPRLANTKYYRTVLGIRESVLLYRNRPVTLAISMLISLFIQFVVILSTALMVYGISGKMFFALYFFYVPFIDIATTFLAFTPGGLGIREGITFIAFSRMGISAETYTIYTGLTAITYLMRIIGVIPLIFNPAMKREIRNKRSQTPPSMNSESPI